MAVVNISILGKNYQIACDAGQEGRIYELAGFVNDRLMQLSKSFPKAQDSLLLVMGAILIEDELQEAKQVSAKMPKLSANKQAPQQVTVLKDEDALASALDAISEYIGNLANKIEKV